ncbi:aminotransferase class III-fold pyridoxal phosphate-dependent enzyme [Aliikangiella sp. IMCC44359]|uniref:aminotransferase class III-fold pyridoxal phosphate-dependent enzyme n=1 Tax=Aliikangiella sp. IMCC44359 TaxID=3459125 RepID=UPI00403A828B
MSTNRLTPIISDSLLLKLIKEHFGLTGQLALLPSYADLNRRFTSQQGKCYVVKVSKVGQNVDELDFENLMMSTLASASVLDIQFPELQKTLEQQSSMVEVLDESNRACQLRVISFIEGTLWANSEINDQNYVKSLGKALAQIDRLLVNIDHPASHRHLIWDMKHSNLIVRKYRDALTEASQLDSVNSILADYEANVFCHYSQLPTQIIYNDANDYNLLVNTETKSLSGIFDFGDAVFSFRIAELAIAAAYIIMNQKNIEVIIQNLVTAYHQSNPLTALEIDVLFDMIRMRLAVSVCVSSDQFAKQPDNDYLLVSQKGAWQAMACLAAIDKVSFSIKLKHLCRLQVAQDSAEVFAYRKRHLSENLSLAYQQPIKMINGKGAYLYSETGQRYLDMVNNVCHVGHCHPSVVTAGQQQMAILNTNTRYLHDNIIHFAKKMLSTMPEELSVCMFVNSGSEANELALRLARAHTNRKSMIVVEGAYHGNTNACVDISPYKFDGPGGNGAPDWVKQTIAPDPYRGKYQGMIPETGKQYALDVQAVIHEFEQENNPVCAFICESIQGVGGQVVHPPGYLEHAYNFVRQAGGLCIADEVQVGMGRVGSHWWAFQTQNVVPDIVTIGKPIGNGHPLAAVVTTHEIAKSFVTGMEYFNTFGGNPVSCAIGLAVMNVVEQEKLMQKAEKVGEYLQTGLKRLSQNFPIIGDVRGLGMFIGAEFVLDRELKEPAVEQISYVIERLKEEGILLTTEGPLHNVLKIKPPLAFSIEDGDYFLKTLECVLAETGAQI